MEQGSSPEITMSGETPLVSAVIPTRDRPDSLRRAVVSVLDQGLEPLEVVVVDDGSQPSVGDEISSMDHRIRVIRIDGSVGPAAARNLGASRAQGSFIAFLDDDDYWLPGKIEACLDCFDRFPQAGAVFHLTGRSESKDEGSECTFHPQPLDRMLLRQPPHLDGVVVRSSVHNAVRFDESFRGAEDLDYLTRACPGHTHG